MRRKPLADAHRRVGEAEHGVEHRMLDHADSLPDPEGVRRRAHHLSDNARKHMVEADRLDREAGE